MPVALYTPITLARPSTILRRRFDGESEWTSVSLAVASFDAWPLFLAALAEALAPTGFELRLSRADNAAGCRVTLSHSLPFELEFPEEGCHAWLGFQAQTYSPPGSSWTSPLSPSGCFVVEGLRDDSGPATVVASAVATSLSGRTDGRSLSTRYPRQLRFTALDVAQTERLKQLWLDAAQNETPLLWDAAFDACLEAPMRQRWTVLRPDLTGQSEWSPSRTWPAPRPARYDADLLFDQQ